MEDDAIGVHVCGELRTANTGDTDLNIYRVDVWGILIGELREIGIGLRPLRTAVATIGGGEVVVKFNIGVLWGPVAGVDIVVFAVRELLKFDTVDVVGCDPEQDDCAADE